MPTTEPSGGTTPGQPANRRYDPDRRERIVEACLDVIAAAGVSGTSHRRVAAAAGVPLGSMTYHFDGMDDLLRAAFTRFADDVADEFERRMRAAGSRREAADAVVALITGDVFATRRDLVLVHELYVLAVRDPGYRTVTAAWMNRSHRALERHFDPATARMLDALIEGLTIQRALETGHEEAADVAEAVRRIAMAG